MLLALSARASLHRGIPTMAPSCPLHSSRFYSPATVVFFRMNGICRSAIAPDTSEGALKAELYQQIRQLQVEVDWAEVRPRSDSHGSWFGSDHEFPWELADGP